MKLQRYDPPRHYTKPIPWIQCDDGDWCSSDDVERLEARYADLLQCLHELYLLVDSKSKHILEEDARNNGFLEVKIIAAIYAEEAQ